MLIKPSWFGLLTAFCLVLGLVCGAEIASSDEPGLQAGFGAADITPSLAGRARLHGGVRQKPQGHGGT